MSLCNLSIYEITNLQVTVKAVYLGASSASHTKSLQATVRRILINNTIYSLFVKADFQASALLVKSHIEDKQSG